MYSADTRATYADLCKTAAAGLPARIGTHLVDAMKEHPLIAAALVTAMGATGGYELGESKEKAKQQSMLQGMQYGHALGRNP